MTSVRVVSAYVIGGKGKDVSVPQLDLDPQSAPADRGLHAAAGLPPVLDTEFDIGANPPSEQDCRNALNDSVLQGTDWRAGALLVLGRAIIDGVWIPIPQAPQRFAYTFLLESRATNLPWQRNVPVRDDFLEMRAVIVVQERV